MLSDDSNGSAPPGVGVGCQDADFSFASILLWLFEGGCDDCDDMCWKLWWR